jgi:hypothetical protein
VCLARTKVNNANVAVLVDDDILRFEIAIDDITLVRVLRRVVTIITARTTRTTTPYRDRRNALGAVEDGSREAERAEAHAREQLAAGHVLHARYTYRCQH